jgi:hypothetical protein
MLSPHDRRLLADIERHLATEQADLAQLLKGFDRWAPPRRRVRHRVLLAVPALGAVLLAVAFAVHNAAMLLLATAALLFEGLALITVAVVKAHGPRPGQDVADPRSHLTR